jgi:hypothetical protein
MAYNFIDQNIVASCLIQGHTDDSFYNPVPNSHTGYAVDGNYYSLGVLQSAHPKASWFTEFATNTSGDRGEQAAFPQFGIALLSPVSLVILDQTKSVAQAEQLPLWMQFLLQDNNALANNFNGAVQGFLPSGLVYADGIVTVIYTPDSGNQAPWNFNAWSNVTLYSSGDLVTYVPGLSRWRAVVVPPDVNPPVGVAPPNLISDGTATGWYPEITQPYPGPYPNVGVSSRMAVSIDFAADSVYLDVAV